MKHVKSRLGYSLAEVIVAAGLFAMVITGGIAGVRMGFSIVDNSRHYTRVSQILQSEVEEIRSLAWNELKTLPSTAKVDIDAQFYTAVYDAYTVERKIFTVTSRLRRVEIEVSYDTRKGTPVTLKYITFFTEGGVNDYYYRII